ncbi:ATP-dependent RNA helicase Ddx1-like [Daphnia pulex]|uniref:ATP-dependent RNA helicase Ddx1-like n=1 Tax=Daphnia pulex TaxID=6669 RepID=UPI001EE05E32|nr:ATP-dependent RNA helicase Ddx1-like [Daphnia pulex]
MAAFEEMGVLPQIAKRLEELDWMLPTDVQAEAVPMILGGGDVLMAAETGSGKTGAFCLPIIQIVWETIKDIQSGKAPTASGNNSAATEPQDKWILSTYDRTPAMAVNPEGTLCQSRDAAWSGIRATQGVVNKGKYFYEATVSDEGLCRVGWSLNEANLDLGTDRYGYGFGGTGKKSNNRQFDDYGTAYGLNDVIGCALDLDNRVISFFKNGVDLGKAFDINPEFKNKALFPAVALKNAELEFNFGQKPFKFAPPKNFVAVCQAAKDCRTVNSNSGVAMPAQVKLKANAPQAIIMEPSRELAEQTYNEINNFKKYLDAPVIRTMLVVGGIPIKEQLSDLQKGVDIIVGTPGRLDELIKSENILLTHCRFFVLDEADGLLQQGQGEIINRLHSRAPKITTDGKRLQMIVCSATLHSFEVKKMADRLMHFPTWIDLKGEDSVPETVHHVVITVDPRTDMSWHNLPKRIPTDGVHAKDRLTPTSATPEMLSEAVKLLKGEYCVRAITEHKMDQAIIFCRTKVDCDNLETYLNSIDKQKFSCVCLHADRKPQERTDNLEAFKQKKAKFLICTDVAARGLDIRGLPFMMNFTLPDDKSNYVHRIGRVGRAERMGLAISFVSNVPEKVWFHGQWCPSHGKGCANTKLTNQGGCCIWYDEQQCLAEVEEHLGITISQAGTDMKVPVDEFDGKVVYGQKKKATTSAYQSHVAQMAGAVQELAVQEMKAQLLFHSFSNNAKKIFGSV